MFVTGKCARSDDKHDNQSEFSNKKLVKNHFES